ncbi:Serine/threonine-protein kinase [Saxophila tyrrhenica]|uniref:non-specific serine/threonine protein kinase n=1 Tax=Saxophila tyrrhenica TaxID=1690608 RepID=A0AAV9PIC6_9PEZI|nr:Serine/threonine-protein kinase [Saxophila tyrrhenica]
MATPRPAPPPSRAPRAPQPDREPNDFIGEFERGKEIGRGSFANVYMAKHRKKKSYAAVKVVIMARVNSRLKVNLDSEIAILRAMDHPHVVALFATQKTPMYYYIVMEYCQLADLSQFTKKRHQIANYPETADIFKRYPNPEYGGLHEVLCRHFFKQLASALEYLRLCQFVHRDIKPQNLLLTPAPMDLRRRTAEDLPLTASKDALDPTVGVQSLPMLKLADFGFARELSSEQMAETLCGSPLYMAPEILRYEKYDNRSDLWSAGVVLYEMLAGRAPFRAANHVELLKKIEKANDEIPFDQRLSVGRDMKGLLRGLLKKKPLDRYSYADMIEDPVVAGDIPGLTPEDKPLLRYRSGPPSDPTGVGKMIVEEDANPTEAPEQVVQPREAQEGAAGPSSRKSSDQESKQRPEAATRRQSSSGQSKEALPADMQRRQSQREQPKQRRPSIVSHATAPARQDLLAGANTSQAPAPRMERRPSRTSPLAGPPMVREPSAVDTDKVAERRAARDARERTAQDMAFEKEYVMVEKRAVEINAFADELEAKRGSAGAAMVRRATTQGQPAPLAGVEPPSTSRAMQVVSTRPQGAHQRGASFERRFGPGAQSATNMLSKALNAANVRLFGALGTSPPFGMGASPSSGYSAFPTYPTPQGALLLTEGGDGKTPTDEDTKIVRTMEDAAHRSDVIFGFAEVKYRQLVPATPSTASDALGIQQIGAQEKPMTASGEDEDKDMTNIAVVGVAEEALVLYVKTLAILGKTTSLAAYWWNKQGNRTEQVASEQPARPTSGSSAEVGKRMNNVVQWARGRFNECLEKSEVVARRLQTAQRELPADHPYHPNNQSAASDSASGGITTSAQHIRITSGVTAEKLMFDRAVEMSRAAALAELVGENLSDCELGYVTAIMLMEAVLENDDEPLMRKPSAKKDKAADEAITGVEDENRQNVIRLIDGARNRLSGLRKKMHAAQQSAKRSSHSGSGGATPKPAANTSSAATPALAGTPPR